MYGEKDSYVINYFRKEKIRQHNQFLIIAKTGQNVYFKGF